MEQLLPETSTDGTWLEQSWTLHPSSDTWVVVEVVGDHSQGDAWRGATPYAAANAFFVDVTGDGWNSTLTWEGDL